MEVWDVFQGTPGVSLHQFLLAEEQRARTQKFQEALLQQQHLKS